MAIIGESLVVTCVFGYGVAAALLGLSASAFRKFFKMKEVGPVYGDLKLLAFAFLFLGVFGLIFATSAWFHLVRPSIADVGLRGVVVLGLICMLAYFNEKIYTRERK